MEPPFSSHGAPFVSHRIFRGTRSNPVQKSADVGRWQSVAASVLRSGRPSSVPSERSIDVRPGHANGARGLLGGSCSRRGERVNRGWKRAPTFQVRLSRSLFPNAGVIFLMGTLLDDSGTAWFAVAGVLDRRLSSASPAHGQHRREILSIAYRRRPGLPPPSPPPPERAFRSCAFGMSCSCLAELKAKPGKHGVIGFGWSCFRLAY